MKILRSIMAIMSLMFAMEMSSQDSLWIDMPQESKPYTRWWWLGSAVDDYGLSHNLKEMSKAGIGGVEITPIYGVEGKEDYEIKYMSKEWMDMLGYTIEKGNELGIETDMSTGTGWPFGGPSVPLSEAACKAIFQDYNVGADSTTLDISCTDRRQKSLPTVGCVMLYEPDQSPVNLTDAVVREGNKSRVFIPASEQSASRRLIVLYIGRTQQMVKRAAPGGEGYVIDHFDSEAVNHYLATFDKAFSESGTSFPHTFFNDSYEVYGADWTPRLLEEFWIRRGYPLEDHFDLFLLPDSLRTDEAKKLMSDYRETLGELLLQNFTFQWTNWAHHHGAITRNQAHGSPANLLDLYSVVDIPECEGFGLSDFHIKGLRTDEGNTKTNDSDISMLKYASSGAHVSGKPFTSSETFTWLTEHFRTSLSQCKPDLDLMFLSGVNHVFFHGSAYSPEFTEWPGWRFYASIDMSEYNPWWDAMPAFSKYIQRCQSFLQWGYPDNDFLVYLPYYDMIYDQPGTITLFDIHGMKKRAPKFISAIESILKEGYDVDYISDRSLNRAHSDEGVIELAAGIRYSAIIVPDAEYMPLETVKKLKELASEGCKVVFVGGYPESVPGLGRELDGENKELWNELADANAFDIAETYSDALLLCKGRQEKMAVDEGLRYIRRSNPYGHHYFISNLQDKDVDSWIQLGVDYEDVLLYNPMTGIVGKPQIRDGKIRLQLASGESIIVRTLNDKSDVEEEYVYYEGGGERVELKKWTLTFPESEPEPIAQSFHMKEAAAWTTLGDARLNTTMATGSYKTNIKLSKKDGQRFVIDCGDVREWVKVIVNGHEAATLFALPFRCDITDYVVDGQNSIELDVTNLPANRIAEMDRQGKQWRIFKEINVVDLRYQKTKYDGWEIVPSGLNSNPFILVY